MEWSNDDCLQLIDYYEQYPVLWEAKHPFHYSKQKKTDAWNEIAEKINRDVNGVKQKMTSLLGSFRAQKSKGRKTVGTGKGRHEVYISKCFAFERMHFLLDKDEPNDTIDTINEDPDILQEPVPSPAETSVSMETEPPTERCSESGGATSQESVYTAGIISDVQSSRVATPVLKKQRTLKEKREDPRLKEAFRILKDTHAKYSASQQQGTPLPSDRFNIYCQYVAHKLRTYSQRTQAIVEDKINNIFFRLIWASMKQCILFHSPPAALFLFLQLTQRTQISYPSSNYARYSSIPSSVPTHLQHTAPSSYLSTSNASLTNLNG